MPQAVPPPASRNRDRSMRLPSSCGLSPATPQTEGRWQSVCVRQAPVPGGDDADCPIGCFNFPHREQGFAFQYAKQIHVETAHQPTAGYPSPAQFRYHFLHEAWRNRFQGLAAEVDVAGHISAFCVKLDRASSHDDEREPVRAKQGCDHPGELERVFKQIGRSLYIGKAALTFSSMPPV